MLVCQNPLQRRHIHKRRHIHDGRHIKLLPHDSTQATWIHPHPHQRHHIWNHFRIKTQRKIRIKWGGIYRRQPQHIWISAVRTPSQRIPWKIINKRSYHQRKLVPGLWKHEWCPAQFTLVVDNFSVRVRVRVGVRVRFQLQTEQPHELRIIVNRRTIHR